SGCSSTLERLKNIGQEPEINTMDIAHDEEEENKNKNCINNTKYYNSLWQCNSRSFFKDNRAHKVGDIIKAKIKISDKAEMQNSSSRSRQSAEGLSLPKLFGLERKIQSYTHDKSVNKTKPEEMLSLKGSNYSNGDASIDRDEKIYIEMAVIVRKVLPNGSLIVGGSQEIRVNYEVRRIMITGIVSPDDIDIDNTIQSSKIAELRVSYGGKGQMTDVQQPRIGHQIIDIISPF
ncbi:MAG: flagellar basal body L-ring protein FlgH, partial [Anaplasmataceae bacterium]|nr:flagellar basal body L-ring protein FlgH [Anaplasmataceae bacterium]